MERTPDPKAEEKTSRVRVRIEVYGIVQGVGFRPHVYRLAKKHDIAGFVANGNGQVVVEAEGKATHIQSFQRDLQYQADKPIQVDSLKMDSIPVRNEHQFEIKPSEDSGRTTSSFPPDLAVCSACLDDVLNPRSRYFQYPFTSCTSCGPRFSAIHSLPYDRENTSFSAFHLCDHCAQAYADPANRRFHAETIACPTCGPQIEGADMASCLSALHNGKIVALKGVGGFHLICDAKRDSVIKQLRIRKHRPNKPFAVMAKDMTMVKSLFEVSQMEEEALQSEAAPIVLLKPKPAAERALPVDTIAPGLARLGVMLPYMPLHHLLFRDGIEWIIATSGNQSGLPIADSNEMAFSQLQGIADLFVLHTREIVIGIDDSVGQATSEGFQLIRRARGFVPEALAVPLPPQFSKKTFVDPPTILGIGADMKNTFCLIHNGKAYLSHHLGDMDTLQSLGAHHSARSHFMKLLDTTPQFTTYDPHPNYVISQQMTDEERAKSISVYHHHAHMAACMAEHGIDKPVIGCILDGTGYGRDGMLWGFEILTGDYLDFEREHFLKPIPLPGGDASIRYPWMIGLSLIYEAVSGDRQAYEAWAADRFLSYRSKFQLVWPQLVGKLPCPFVSSAGRLFDGIAAILNVCTESTYEGEAAIRLSDLVESTSCSDTRFDEGLYPFDIEGEQWVVASFVKRILQDLKEGVPISVIARKCHHTLSSMILEGVRKASQRTGITSVVLSGGVWNNRYLLRVTKDVLIEEGFTVYSHQKIPAGDGGIALGQAICGLWRWAKENVFIGTDTSRGSV